MSEDISKALQKAYGIRYNERGVFVPNTGMARRKNSGKGK